MIDIAVDFLGHISYVIASFFSGEVRASTSSNVTISIFALFLFYWVIYLFIWLFKNWVNKRG